DADTWLATAFSAHERIVAQEKELALASGGKLTSDDEEQVRLALFAHRADYELASRSRPEKALAETRADVRTDEWHRVAPSKGVLLLAELRKTLGAEVFDPMMDEFGRRHAGKAATTSEFVTHVEKKAGKKLGDFFDRWLNATGLPASRSGSGPFGVLSFYPEI